LIHQELLLPVFTIFNTLFKLSISLANSNPKHFLLSKTGYNGS
jgi:hypothetical protein